LIRCRFCGAALSDVFVDLGMSPLSNAYLTSDQLQQMEPFFPLRVFVCASCLLVQLPAVQTPEAIFGDYAYFSSYSESWLRHASEYVENVSTRFHIGPGHRVVELASNDGYLLQYFVARGVSVLGVEPAANVARVAESRGIPTLVRFFGAETANDIVLEGGPADLIVANNVLAHVPDLNDFVAGMAILLRDDGVITVEVPHLLELMRGSQFDTIYHEHFSYFSVLVARKVFAAHGLAVFDVDRLPTHGGSLRLYVQHESGGRQSISKHVSAIEEDERAAGLDRINGYAGFDLQVRRVKLELLQFLTAVKREGKTLAAYGAAAKGNTLLNYCGIRADILDFVVDRNPYKQGRFLPGTHIPIHAPEVIAERRPDFLLILPWNIRGEIMEQMSAIREWGGRFVIPIPRLEVIP
jgi:SAM-dependent methyltransferase